MGKRWRIAAVNFDHFHMGDLLRMVWEHSAAEIVGICDARPARMQQAIANFQIPAERVFTDYVQCLEITRPDLVILCPATAEHALWTEPRCAVRRSRADREAVRGDVGGRRSHAGSAVRHGPTAGDQLAAALVPDARHGVPPDRRGSDWRRDRGPLLRWQSRAVVARRRQDRPRAHGAGEGVQLVLPAPSGGGSLLDYLGYGTTLATWYHANRKPLEVICMLDQPAGLEVDEHSITVARYEVGLSKFETRWGTFTDPWTHQPQPKCGFVIRGTEGTISSYDFEPTVRLQTRDRPQGQALPVDRPAAPATDPVQYFLHCLETDQPIDGPLSPEVSRIGQQMVDTAFLSAQQKRALPLLDSEGSL